MTLEEMREKLTAKTAEKERKLGEIDSNKKRLKELTGTDNIKKAKKILAQQEEALEDQREEFKTNKKKFEDKYAAHLQ